MLLRKERAVQVEVVFLVLPPADLFLPYGQLLKKQQFLIVESTIKLIVDSTIKNGDFDEFTSAYFSEKKPAARNLL